MAPKLRHLSGIVQCKLYQFETKFKPMRSCPHRGLNYVNTIRRFAKLQACKHPTTCPKPIYNVDVGMTKSVVRSWKSPTEISVVNLPRILSLPPVTPCTVTLFRVSSSTLSGSRLASQIVTPASESTSP